MAQCFRVYTVLRSQVQFPVLHNSQIITACGASSRAPSVSALLRPWPFKVNFKSYAKPLVPFSPTWVAMCPLGRWTSKEQNLATTKLTTECVSMWRSSRGQVSAQRTWCGSEPHGLQSRAEWSVVHVAMK